MPGVPAAVVVDTENFRGKAEAVLGFRGWPSVAGIADAMALYGFEAVTIGVSIAFGRPQDLERGSNPDIARRHRQAERFSEEVLSDDRGLVLRGHWARREKDRLGEKASDVACAVEICRRAAEIRDRRGSARVILVLSEDSDLNPALDYARSLGVGVVTFGTRNRLWWSPVWVALHDAPLRRSFAVSASVPTGWELRRLMAQALDGAGAGECGPWPARLGRRGTDHCDCEIHHPLGWLPATVAGGWHDSPRLYLAGVHPGRPGERFPRLICQAGEPGSVERLSRWTVRARTSTLHVKVGRRGQELRVEAPLGGLAIGTRVAVAQHKQCLAAEGPVEPGLDEVHLLEVTERLRGSRVLAKDPAGEPWVLDDPAQPLEVGEVLAALHCGEVVEPRACHLARPVSAPLPR